MSYSFHAYSAVLTEITVFVNRILLFLLTLLIMELGKCLTLKTGLQVQLGVLKIILVFTSEIKHFATDSSFSW